MSFLAMELTKKVKVEQKVAQPLFSYKHQSYCSASCSPAVPASSLD